MDRLFGKETPLLRGTVDSGTTTSMTDAAVARPESTADHYDGGYLKIVTDTAGAAPQGDVRSISGGGFTVATGVVTVSAAFSSGSSPAVGDTHEIWPGSYQEGGGWHPDAIDSIINQKLRELHMPSLFPLSADLVASDNNNFEQTITTNAITGWTLNGSATAVNETDAALVYNGTRVAKITHTTASTDFYNRIINFPPGENLYTAAVAACNTGDTARLLVRDSTNSATIQDAASQSVTPIELIIPWTVPSSSRAQHIRLLGDTNGDVTYWDDYQTWYQKQGMYPLPSWITRKEQIISIVAFPPGQGGTQGEFDYHTNQRRSQQISYRFERADTRATSELYVWAQSYFNWRPYIIAYRPLDEVTADYVTTVANTVPLSSTETDALVLGVMSEIHKQQIPTTVGEVRQMHTRLFGEYSTEFVRATRHLRPPEQQEQKLNRVWSGVA